MGLSISSTVVQQSLRNQLRDRLSSGKDADEIVRRVRQSLDYVKTLDPAIRALVRQSYESATQTGFGLMLGIVALSMISSCECFHLMDVRLKDHAYNIVKFSSAKRNLVE